MKIYSHWLKEKCERIRHHTCLLFFTAVVLNTDYLMHLMITKQQNSSVS